MSSRPASPFFQKSNTAHSCSKQTCWALLLLQSRCTSIVQHAQCTKVPCLLTLMLHILTSPSVPPDAIRWPSQDRPRSVISPVWPRAHTSSRPVCRLQICSSSSIRIRIKVHDTGQQLPQATKRSKTGPHVSVIPPTCVVCCLHLHICCGLTADAKTPFVTDAHCSHSHCHHAHRPCVRVHLP